MAVNNGIPVDCSLYLVDEGDVLPCMDEGPQWWQLGRQLQGSLLVAAVGVGMSVVVEPAWARLCATRGRPPLFVINYVGTSERPPRFTTLARLVDLLEFVGSSFIMCAWVASTYRRGPERGSLHLAELACVAMCATHSLFKHVQSGFSVANACSVGAILDCLTLPAVALRSPLLGVGTRNLPALGGVAREAPLLGGSWLTLGYLRAYHQTMVVKRVRGVGLLDAALSNFQQEVVIVIAELTLVVFTIAGTMWILEGLGDIEGLSDAFLMSGMGGISFLQMVYFTFITISTVGYGDYSPSTVLSRIFTIVTIFVGVSFFSYMCAKLLEISNQEASGLGSFRPSKKDASGRGHILVVGGGVTCGSVTVLETFLKGLCRDDNSTPEVVLLSQTPCSEDVRALLKESWAAAMPVSFFLGSALEAKDLKRVGAGRASMVFILADFSTNNTAEEDAGNLMLAVSLQRLFPALQLRLMLVGISALSRASQIGLSEYNCFSIEAFKGAFLGSASRCPGFATLVLNLTLPDLPNTAAEGWAALGLAPGERGAPWLEEYAAGSRLEPYGFLPARRFVGRSFKQAALDMAKTAANATGVRAAAGAGNSPLLVAAQVNGAIRLNPSAATVTATTVLFALAPSVEAVGPVALGGDARVSTWISTFQANRRAGTFGALQHAKAVRLFDDDALSRFYAAATAFDGHKGGAMCEVGGAGKAAHIATLTPRQHPGHQPDDGGSGGGGGGGDGGAGRTRTFSGAPPVLGGISSLVRNQTATGNASDYGGGGFRRTARPEQPVATLMDVAGMKAAAEKAARMAAAGGHTVVLLMDDSDGSDLETVWQQLEVCLNVLFEAEGPSPVVVVHGREQAHTRDLFLATLPDGSSLRSGAVAFLVSPPTSGVCLQGAGVPAARRLLTLAPSAPDSDDLGAGVVAQSQSSLDRANVILALLLEEHFTSAWTKRRFAPNGMSFKDGGAGGGAGSATGSALDDGTLLRRSKLPVPCLFDMYTAHAHGFLPVMPADPTHPAHAIDDALAELEPRAHPRFASGGVLPKPYLAAMFSMAFYAPGVLELVEGLANPGKYAQDSVVWALPPPPAAVGAAYCHLAAALQREGAAPLGLLRHATDPSGALPYVVTALPDDGMLVGKFDTVFVLGDRAWAAAKGLTVRPDSPRADNFGAAQEGEAWTPYRPPAPGARPSSPATASSGGFSSPFAAPATASSLESTLWAEASDDGGDGDESGHAPRVPWAPMARVQPPSAPPKVLPVVPLPVMARVGRGGGVGSQVGRGPQLPMSTQVPAAAPVVGGAQYEL